jgi:hypothetical protein
MKWAFVFALAACQQAPLASGGAVGACPVFPADNAWNTDISKLPVDDNSAAYLAAMNASTTKLHPDFGQDSTYGIPYIVVIGSAAKFPATFDYADESDAGPYPIPMNAPIEGGASADGDRHTLAVDKDNCKLYELYDAHPLGNAWHAGSGAIFDLRSNALRPDGWTSADAAGLPIFPGLVRYEEAVEAGAITHALRFTAARTQNAFVHPATHGASNASDPTLPPMGTRVRLKASFDTTPFAAPVKAILLAMQTYGMFLADNGSDWYVSGSTDARWNDDDLAPLKTVPASAFEVVQLGAITPQP